MTNGDFFDVPVGWQKKGADACGRGGGILGVRTHPPPIFFLFFFLGGGRRGGIPKLHKEASGGKGKLHTCLQLHHILVHNSYPDPNPPPSEILDTPLNESYQVACI